MDPFLSWAAEAHWSMGGLSFKRLRLQGRIEGSISKVRAGRKRKDSVGGDVKAGVSVARSEFDSPPPAPVAAKRRRFMTLIADEEEEEEEERKGRARRCSWEPRLGRLICRRRLGRLGKGGATRDNGRRIGEADL